MQGFLEFECLGLDQQPKYCGHALGMIPRQGNKDLKGKSCPESEGQVKTKAQLPGGRL